MSKNESCPPPGIYHNVDFETYLTWDAISNSKLGLMAKSPAHYAAGFQGEPTKAMSLGSLAHCGILEPLAIAKRYTFCPKYSEHPDNVTANGERSFSASTKFVKSMEDQFRKLNHDKEIIAEADYLKMVGIAGTLSGCPIIRGLMSSGRPEVSIVFDEQSSGLRCKARADWLHVGKDSAVLLDLKTCADASEFERSIVRYGYHRQMAFYRRAVEVATGIRPAVFICAVETSAPFGHRVALVAPEAMVIGADEADELLARIADCSVAGEWPSYSHPDSWELPEWYRRSQPVELTIGDEILSVGGKS